MNKSTKIAFAVLCLIIIVLSAVIILRPTPAKEKFDDKPYIDSIAVLRKEIDVLHVKNDSVTKHYEGLAAEKVTIKIIYREKYNFIKGASASELDSIIRWGL